jgi:hypothetical protein
MCKSAAPFIVLLIILCSSFSSAVAGIVVFDDVIPVNKTIKLNALTKGMFLPEGGKLVKFYVNGKYLGTNLSGGDGYALLEYVPSSAGTFSLKVESGKDTDEGSLLVTAENDRILLIEIERVFAEFPVSFKPAKDSAEVVPELSKKFRIIYLTTLTGVELSRKLLKENGLPVSPVLKWEGPQMLDELAERGIKLHAIIASAGILSEAPDIKKKYSFEETEDGTEEKEWKDILKHLDMNKAK